MSMLTSSTRPLGVAVVCEDDRVRAGLRHLIVSRGNFVVVESSAGGNRPDTNSASVGCEADVAVVDRQPAQGTDHDLLRDLPRDLPAVVLGYDDVTARAAQAAGAAYLDKADVCEQLLPTMHAVVRSRGDPADGPGGHREGRLAEGAPAVSSGAVDPLSAAVVLGMVWAVWHLPLLVAQGETDQGPPAVPFWLLVVATSVLVAALVNAAQGSVLVIASRGRLFLVDSPGVRGRTETKLDPAAHTHENGKQEAGK